MEQITEGIEDPLTNNAQVHKFNNSNQDSSFE